MSVSLFEPIKQIWSGKWKNNLQGINRASKDNNFLRVGVVLFFDLFTTCF